MKKRIMMQFVSSINVSKQTLWQSINTFQKLNCELWPVLKMTCPSKYRELPFEEFPMNEYAFTSIVLLFAFIPIEIYNARLISVVSNSCFFEESKSLLTSSWKHTRILEATDDGCTINDTIDITLRYKLFYPLFTLLLKLVFRTRHKNLKNVK